MRTTSGKENKKSTELFGVGLYGRLRTGNPTEFPVNQRFRRSSNSTAPVDINLSFAVLIAVNVKISVGLVEAPKIAIANFMCK